MTTYLEAVFCALLEVKLDRRFFLVGALLISAPGLSGCSTNGASITDFLNFTSLPADGITQIEGSAVTAQYTHDLTSGTTAVSGLSGTQAASARVTTETDIGVSLSVSAPGSSVAFNFGTNGSDTATSSGGLIIFSSADGSRHAVFLDPDVGGFEFQTFGVWITGFGTGSGTLGVGSFGAKTASASMPSGTTASYSGSSVGFLADLSGQPFFTASNVTVTTDFSNATITSSGTQKSNLNTGAESSASNLDFTGTGSVLGAGFLTNITGTGVSGTADGIFYGPNANEVGGTFSASGTGGLYVGSYGAN